jgi:hypoxanthine-guanine phosphoribosyltransferase/DNA-binding transcriptional ArsR family regulator
MEKTGTKILSYIKTKGQVSPAELSIYLNINRQATHRQIKRLLDSGLISKAGKPPKVFYSLVETKKINTDIKIDNKSKKIINENFLLITPSGERKEGMEAFIDWCQKRNEPVEKTAKEYTESLKKYAKYRKGGLINGDYKMKHTFKEVFLDKTFYLDFYSIERFGKTKLGQLLLYAKQSQNQDLINELVDKIKFQINSLVKKYKINAVGFIPPTVKREVQLMKEIEKKLNLSITAISLVKIKTTVTVPQKTLNKLEDRIENAKDTIILDDNRKYSKILLIDDALGSGATLNEIARKIKQQNPRCKIIGLAITGSFSGFEVISEV